MEQQTCAAAALSSALVERAFSHRDVPRFRAEADQNGDHNRRHSGNPASAQL
jgi:hypothetical protein